MSDFHDKPIYPKARKPHLCIACETMIPKDERYTQQSGFYEGRPYRNHYHNECWDYLSNEGMFEFMPGEVDPPERLKDKP